MCLPQPTEHSLNFAPIRNFPTLFIAYQRRSVATSTQQHQIFLFGPNIPYGTPAPFSHLLFRALPGASVRSMIHSGFTGLMIGMRSNMIMLRKEIGACGLSRSIAGFGSP
jgi:hypothetical protein